MSKEETRVRWSVRLGGLVIRLLSLTWRYRVENDAGWMALRADGQAFIFTLWHGELLPLTWRHRRQGITAMISEHRDGEIIARLVESWGYRTVRGSSSRGAGRALLGMVRDLQAGREFAITPDGPRGPAGKAQPGILLASQRAQAPIVTIRADISRAWRMKSWDSFVIPKPFARINVIYGDPWLPKGIDERAAADLTALLGPPIHRDASRLPGAGQASISTQPPVTGQNSGAE